MTYSAMGQLGPPGRAGIPLFKTEAFEGVSYRTVDPVHTGYFNLCAAGWDYLPKHLAAGAPAALKLDEVEFEPTKEGKADTSKSLAAWIAAKVAEGKGVVVAPFKGDPTDAFCAPVSLTGSLPTPQGTVTAFATTNVTLAGSITKRNPMAYVLYAPAAGWVKGPAPKMSTTQVLGVAAGIVLLGGAILYVSKK